MDNFKRSEELDDGVSFYSRSTSLIDADPLDEIFALNLGDFLSEHLINPELANKISSNVRSKNDCLKRQLSELISLYSVNSTLALLGYENGDESAVYSSVADTLKLMLSLKECNIYLSKNGGAPEYIEKCGKSKKSVEFIQNDLQVLAFPMKNSFECIGAMELIRPAEKPLEQEFRDFAEATAGLFVTSLGLQKLIDRTKQIMSSDIVSTTELQNLRAQLTAIIGDLGDQQQSFVEILATAVDCKGAHQKDHSTHTAELSRELCLHIGLNEKTTDLIYYAGLLQNVGQITLSEELLNKKGTLTEAEFVKLQNSQNEAVNLLMNINFLSEVIPYIHYHKERWDGKGVPEGLAGMSIPFGSRVIALAGAYCALTEDRPHRAALSSEKALDIIAKESEIKWDPVVVQALLELKRQL
jgi:HD-GYP domain-containing protein (c-di-GMP phosphodiesterase class II)